MFNKFISTDMIFTMNSGFAEIVIGTPIDLFFHGLAKPWKNKSIGVPMTISANPLFIVKIISVDMNLLNNNSL